MEPGNPDTTLKLDGMAPLLQVFDMPASLQFYRDILGFKVVRASTGTGDDVDWVLMQYQEIYLMLNTAYEKPDRPPAPDERRIAAHEDLTLYFGCPDIDQAYLHLHNKGVELGKPSLTGYGWMAISFSDPDGYHICFHWPSGDNKANVS